MKTILFTNKCSHAAEILKTSKRDGIPISAIIIEKPAARSIKQRLKSIAQRSYSELVITIANKIMQRFFPSESAEWNNDGYYHDFSDTILTVENFNSTQCEQIIKAMAPDIIILGGARIIRNNIIKIPKIGILNAHPGLLPKYRGVDVIPWAILNGDDVGVTVHFIDEEVDTGEICLQEKLHLTSNDTIQTLREKTEILAGELMAKVLKMIIKYGTIHTIQNLKEKGQQFYQMTPRNLANAEKHLQARLSNDRQNA